jgi:hypothetical protein
MVFLSTTAQIIDTLIVKVTLFTVDQLWYLIKWGGSSAYQYYYPILSDNDLLKIENVKLKSQLKLLKNYPEK